MEQQRYLADERWKAIQIGTQTIPTTPWAIARMNEIQHLGRIDRKVDGPGYRTYTGPVGKGDAARMMDAQITEHAGDLCICFWGQDSRARRLLVTAGGELWIEVWSSQREVKAIRHTGKYADAWANLVKVRTSCGKEAHRG